MGRQLAPGLLVLVLLAGCVGASDEVVDEPALTIPDGVLAAMPFQNRLDVAQGIFQVKIYNGTNEPISVVGAQFVWDGFTTPVGDQRNGVLAGGRVDFPVPFVVATCAGDGSAATMPDLATAAVRLTLADGATRDVPVYDVKHFARRLYLGDCARQRIASLVRIEWVDLHEATFEGRPVTEGELRLVRRESGAEISIVFVSNTINFTFVAIDGGGADGNEDDPVAVLANDEQSVAVPVRFIEGRCDAHALSESSQPFNFIAVVDLGDGVERSFAVVPRPEDQVPMKTRVAAACAILGGRSAVTP